MGEPIWGSLPEHALYVCGTKLLFDGRIPPDMRDQLRMKCQALSDEIESATFTERVKAGTVLQR